MNDPGQASRSYDVVVVGGGTSGVIAATQSAAAGARTLLLERGSILGGTITTAAVNYPGLFHAWEKQIIAGYGWKLVSRCVAEQGGTMPDFSVVPERHWQHQVRVNPGLYAMLCDEMVSAAGADILFYVMPAGLARHNDHWRLTLCGKTGWFDLQATCLVDCTGDANLVSLAGGRIRSTVDQHQPATQCCQVSGYEIEDLDIDALNHAFAEAVKDGELSAYDAGWSSQSLDLRTWLGKSGDNANHIPDIDARDSWGRSRLALAGRQSVLRLYRFLRRQPGLENYRLDSLAPECGVRETAVIVGDQTVTQSDYSTARPWQDAICYSFYPIDLHTADATGLDCRPLQPGTVPTVPRGALLPQGLNGIIAAGRCISSDRLANSALRVQATCMATGQAAGALAALAAQRGIDMRELDLGSSKDLLRQHDAIVPPDPPRTV